ncbi:MAG: TrmO family methyltransferase [Saccharofermentans sp.]|nr:TrmO family methyltransferase [Saccharofermentans sp.]
MKEISMKPIGYVKNDVQEKKDVSWGDDISDILLEEDYIKGLRGLDAISGTPVLDIKPYYPVYDKKEAKTPEWVDRLMVKYF